MMQVHHVDPSGHDSGVVYSEMQGRENTSGDLMALRYVSSCHIESGAHSTVCE